MFKVNDIVEVKFFGIIREARIVENVGYDTYWIELIPRQKFTDVYFGIEGESRRDNTQWLFNHYYLIPNNKKFDDFIKKDTRYGIAKFLESIEK